MAAKPPSVSRQTASSSASAASVASGVVVGTRVRRVIVEPRASTARAFVPPSSTPAMVRSSSPTRAPHASTNSRRPRPMMNRDPRPYEHPFLAPHPAARAVAVEDADGDDRRKPVQRVELMGLEVVARHQHGAGDRLDERHRLRHHDRHDEHVAAKPRRAEHRQPVRRQRPGPGERIRGDQHPAEVAMPAHEPRGVGDEHGHARQYCGALPQPMGQDMTVRSCFRPSVQIGRRGHGGAGRVEGVDACGVDAPLGEHLARVLAWSRRWAVDRGRRAAEARRRRRLRRRRRRRRTCRGRRCGGGLRPRSS